MNTQEEKKSVPDVLAAPAQTNVNDLIFNSIYNQAITHAIEVAKGQTIYPVDGKEGVFIEQRAIISLLEQLKKPS